MSPELSVVTNPNHSTNSQIGGMVDVLAGKCLASVGKTNTPKTLKSQSKQKPNAANSKYKRNEDIVKLSQ
nr:hypothetical protein [Saccharobesus litoralis]